ncbi:MAG TPA: hypothetical protein VE981_19245 [Planctomycetota bacterium]|nr:hypothetical protein [Planctomycetota bacterium]
MILAAGFCLLSGVAWHWREGRALVEPAHPGRTPDRSNSLFFGPLDQSVQERRRLIAEDILRDREEFLERRFWNRIHPYALAPGGLMLLLAGTWRIRARHRKD